MNQAIKVSRGTVIGIGKVKTLKSRGFIYEIPLLSFLVINEAQNNFISSCMHLHIDGYGTVEDAAVNDMIDNINYFLKANFSKLSTEDAWLNLKDLSHIDEATKELWDAYRDVQFDLAAEGIPTDSVESLRKRISQLEAENTQLKEELSLIVDYTPLQKVS